MLFLFLRLNFHFCSSSCIFKGPFLCQLCLFLSCISCIFHYVSISSFLFTLKYLLFCLTLKHFLQAYHHLQLVAYPFSLQCNNFKECTVSDFYSPFIFASHWNLTSGAALKLVSPMILLSLNPTVMSWYFSAWTSLHPLILWAVPSTFKHSLPTIL